MKKSLIPLSILRIGLLASSLGSTGVFAEQRQIDGQTYWTVDELEEASVAAAAEKDALCHGDRACEEDLRWSRYEAGGIYRALESYESPSLLLTSINPVAGTMKLLYRNEDKWMSQMMGESVYHEMNNIYMVWVEDTIEGDPMSDASWLSYGMRYPAFLPYAEDLTHVIIDENKTLLGDGWFTPNVEREYSIASSGIANNTAGKVYYAFDQKNGGRSMSAVNYSSCLASPEYRPGMDCRLAYGDEGWQTYLAVEPVAEPAIEPEPTTDEVTTEPAGEVSNMDNSTAEITEPTSTVTETSTNSTAPSADGASVISTSTIQVPTSTSSVSDAKSTGNDNVEVSSATTAARENVPSGDYVETPGSLAPKRTNSDFPWWWLVGLFVAAGAIFTWLLLPSRKKRR